MMTSLNAESAATQSVSQTLQNYDTHMSPELVVAHGISVVIPQMKTILRDRSHNR